MLDQENGQTIFLADFVHKVCQFQCLLGVHAGCRLVQEQEFGVGGKGAGDLQSSLQTVGEAGRQFVLEGFQTLFHQKIHGLLAHALLLFQIGAQDGGEDVLFCPHMFGGQNIFKYGHALPETDVLESTRNPQLCDLIRCGGQDVLAGISILVLSLVDFDVFPAGVGADHGLSHKLDQAVGGLIDTCDTVERCGLSGSVGADERDDLSFGNIQCQVVDRNDAAELHGHIFQMQGDFLIFLILCAHIQPS